MSTPQRRSMMDDLREVTPKLVDYTLDFVLGEVWERPELSKRDRSLLTIAVLTALYRTEELRGHIGLGLRNGLTREEIAEIITHVAFYGGFPTAINGARVAREVFQQQDAQQT